VGREVSRPVYLGGLGFGMKWNMGWMHDTLNYFQNDPVHRKYHHDELSFSLWYAFHENFVLPLSHDEVVHGKGSLIGKMPATTGRSFANLRLLFGYMWAIRARSCSSWAASSASGAKWTHEQSLEWHVLQLDQRHGGVQQWVSDLNRLYKSERAMHGKDFSQEGFQWISRTDWEQSVIAFLRKDSGSPPVLVVCTSRRSPATGTGRRARSGPLQELITATRRYTAAAAWEISCGSRLKRCLSTARTIRSRCPCPPWSDFPQACISRQRAPKLRRPGRSSNRSARRSIAGASHQARARRRGPGRGRRVRRRP